VEWNRRTHVYMYVGTLDEPIGGEPEFGLVLLLLVKIPGQQCLEQYVLGFVPHIDEMDGAELQMAINETRNYGERFSAGIEHPFVVEPSVEKFFNQTLAQERVP